ncbi:MAG: dethiobiotin synthase [Proteobacteria bacterium]|nr:dethiobiotin synthase [Pseudomonadota bacterium]
MCWRSPGYDETDPTSDSALILRSCGITPSPQGMAAISPWRYTAPLAPNMAAQLEGGSVKLDELVAFCREYEGLAQDIVLAEGAGGVMVPLNDEHTILDWMAELGWPVMLVTGTYLGSISHTLTALLALQQRGIALHALLLNESEKGVDIEATAATLEGHMAKILGRAGTPVVKIRRVAAAAGGELWQHMPRLSELCEE